MFKSTELYSRAPTFHDTDARHILPSESVSSLPVEWCPPSLHVFLSLLLTASLPLALQNIAVSTNNTSPSSPFPATASSTAPSLIYIQCLTLSVALMSSPAIFECLTRLRHRPLPSCSTPNPEKNKHPTSHSSLAVSADSQEQILARN